MIFNQSKDNARIREKCEAEISSVTANATAAAKQTAEDNLACSKKARTAMHVERALASDKFAIAVASAKSNLEDSELKVSQMMTTLRRENEHAASAKKSANIAITQKEVVKVSATQNTKRRIEAKYRARMEALQDQVKKNVGVG